MRHSFVSQWIDNCSHHLGWWSGPQTQSHSFASKQHTILSITHFQVKQLSDKTKFSWNPLTHHPLGYVLLCYGGQLVQEHCLPLRQMWNLQENTPKLLMSNKLWGNICQCNLCVASSIKKKSQQRKEMETIPQWGQPLLAHICLSWDSGYKSGCGGGGMPEKEDWKRGQLLYLEFVARKQKSC